MAPAFAISGSKSNEATGFEASGGSLVPCTNRTRKGKRKVKAMVVENNLKDLQEMLASLMENDANGDRENVIGFDVEYAISYGLTIPLNGQKTRISHLIFSNGKKAWVVFPGPILPEPIMWLLLHPEFTFVSMGMKQRIDSLAQLYGAGCRNAVDLGQLASDVKGNPRLRNCGIDLLANGIGLSETPRPSSVVCKEGFTRPYRMVDEDEMTEAVDNTYAFQQIGKILLYG